MKTKRLIDEISDLPVDQRVEIADQILQTLNAPDPEVEEAWIHEVEARLEEYRQGKVKLIPAEEVFKSLRAITDEWELYFTPQLNGKHNGQLTHYTEIYRPLGKDFRQELEEAVLRILKAPAAWHPLKKDYRRCSLNRFPFGIIYRVDEQKNECQIFAVMHFKRNPGYWESRKL